MKDRPQRTRPEFDALPGWGAVDGGVRKAGFELEFAGLTQKQAAEAAQAIVGGRIEARSHGDLVLTGSDLGDLKIYLDTALRKKASGAVAEAGLDLGRAVIPIEIVTPPLEHEQRLQLDRMREALRHAGATGTGGGLLFGFGLHLNPALADPEGGDLPTVGAAYALLEDWLRKYADLDLSRRLLPFTQRYPATWLDWISTEGANAAPETFAAAYLDRIPSRNHGLDLLPAIRSIWPQLYDQKSADDMSVLARPAYHVRAPDCRIDEAGWSIAQEWNRWVLVERVARTPGVMDDLRSAWTARRGPVRRVGPDWIETVGGILSAANLDPETRT